MEKINKLVGKNRSQIVREALDLYLTPWKEVMKVTDVKIKKEIEDLNRQNDIFSALDRARH